MDNQSALFSKALLLSYFTIIYNILEGVVSIALGLQDETLALFGFGVDSFIEVLSGTGILVMLLRIRRNPFSSRRKFEISALRITGVSFFLLSAGLLAAIIVNIATDHKPESTFWGIVVSIVSIAVMIWLMTAKRNTGIKLDSEPLICDSNCTRVCVYMSVVLLISSLIYELTGFAYADSIGAAGLIYFSITEGLEAFGKAGEKDEPSLVGESK